MTHNLFIGRKKELRDLHFLLEKKSPSLAVIEGRRRIGKSRLIEGFSKGNTFIRFTGLPPTKDITAQIERDILNSRNIYN